MPDSPSRPLDRRTIDRYVKRGELTDKDLEKHLKALPDLADESEVIQAQFETRKPVTPHS